MPHFYHACGKLKIGLWTHVLVCLGQKMRNLCSGSKHTGPGTGSAGEGVCGHQLQDGSKKAREGA
jgi:hypothetical protein